MANPIAPPVAIQPTLNEKIKAVATDIQQKITAVGQKIFSFLKDKVWENGIKPLYLKHFEPLKTRDKILVGVLLGGAVVLSILACTVFSQAFLGMGMIGSAVLLIGAVAYRSMQMKTVRDNELWEDLDNLRNNFDKESPDLRNHVAELMKPLNDKKYSHKGKDEDLKEFKKNAERFISESGSELNIYNLPAYRDHIQQLVKILPKKKIDNEQEEEVPPVDPEENKPIVKTEGDLLVEALEKMKSPKDIGAVLTAYYALSSKLQEDYGTMAPNYLVGIKDAINDISKKPQFRSQEVRNKTFCDQIEALMKKLASHRPITPKIVAPEVEVAAE